MQGTSPLEHCRIRGSSGPYLRGIGSPINIPMNSPLRIDIQALRGLAVLSVIAFHVWPRNVPSGYLGVDIFFVISGYLMARLYAGESAVDFYRKRMIRLLPAYFFATLLTLALGLFHTTPHEYASLKHHEGLSASGAALEAARLRFRPIIMTSLAFILGVLPLAFSSGAGSAARRSVGTGVMGGMLAATFLAIFFVPMFFKVITARKLRESRSTEEMQEEARRVHEAQQRSVQHPSAHPPIEGGAAQGEPA